MTLAIRIDGSVTSVSGFDRSFSDEANTVRLILAAPGETPSISSSHRTNATLAALRSAFSGAWEAGWDGHAARPADPNAFIHAVRLLDDLPLDMPLPEVGVDADGDVAFEWDEGPRRIFSLRVSRDGTLHYAGLVGHSTFHGSEALRQGLPRMVSMGIDRVISGSPV